MFYLFLYENTYCILYVVCICNNVQYTITKYLIMCFITVFFLCVHVNNDRIFVRNLM